MSSRQFLGVTHLSNHLSSRAKGPAKTVGKARPTTHARTPDHHDGGIAQTIRRLATFIKTRKKTAACILVVVGGLIWFAVPFPNEFTLTNLLREQGYWETVPPAEYYLPGTINTIEVQSGGRITLHPTCKIHPGLLSKITLQSRTIDRNLAERLNKKFVVTDKMKDFLPIEIRGAKARSFDLSLRDSNILEITDEELFEIQRELVGGSCEKAIEININSGATVCQTRSALRGDLFYDISYETKGSAHVKDPESGFQIEPGQGNEDQVVGKGLIYGVSFMSHGIVLNTPDAKPADCRMIAKSKT